MTSKEYLDILRDNLMGMSAEEKNDIVEYYTEYFEEAGPEKEAEIMEELGNPRALAIRLSGETALKSLNETEAPAVDTKGSSVQNAGSPASQKGSVWKTVLIVLALIIGSPLILPAAIVALVLLIVIVAVIFALGVSAAAIVLAGIMAFFAGIAAIVAGAAGKGILAIGTAFVTLGLAILGVLLIILIVKGIQKLIIYIGNKKLKSEVSDHEQKD